MKFNKIILSTGAAFISECGNYKAVNYGGNIFLFKKIECGRGKKKYKAFGDPVEYDTFGRSKSYRTYREAFKVVNNE